MYASVSNTAEGGYCLVGWAKMFVNVPGDGERKHTDLQGRKWEHVNFAGSTCDLTRDEESPLGFRMKKMQTFGNPTPILSVAVKRGLVPVET